MLSAPFSRRAFLKASLIIGAGSFTNPKFPFGHRGYYAPQDSVPHECTWMAWPDSESIWGSLLSGAQSNIAVIAKTIAKCEPVVMCANASSIFEAKVMCEPTVRVIDSIPVNDCWMRDTGPIFRVNGRGGLDAVGLNFNGWGNKQVHNHDARVAQRVAEYVGVNFTRADFVSEGGAIETDGDGTLMATESSIINSNRNKGLSKAQIQAAMCAAYGASKVIWFPGIAGQDITDDHVDATSRFLGDDGAVVQRPQDSQHDIWARDQRQQRRVLSASRDADGRAITVSEILGADYNELRQTDPNFLASYANYYVCNGAVISAQFGDADCDAAAKATLERLFPARIIEQLNIDALGLGGGGIHCVTLQQPMCRCH